MTVFEKLRGEKKPIKIWATRKPEEAGDSDSICEYWFNLTPLRSVSLCAMSLAYAQTLHCTGPVLHSFVAETQSSTGDACPTCVTQSPRLAPVARTHAHPLSVLFTRTDPHGRPSSSPNRSRTPPSTLPPPPTHSTALPRQVYHAVTLRSPFPSTIYRSVPLCHTHG